MLGHTFPEKLEYFPPFSGLVSNFYLRRDIKVTDHEDPSTMQKTRLFAGCCYSSWRWMCGSTFS